MKTKRKFGNPLLSSIVLCFFAALTLNLYGCSPGNSPADKDNTGAANVTGMSSSSKDKPVKDALDKAKKDGNVVFLIVTGTGAAALADAVTLAGEAVKKVKKSVLIQMDRDVTDNSDMVSRYGVAGVAVPFILVISAKGYAVGGFPAEMATVEKLVNLIPSPKYDEVLEALNSRKPVFVVASKKSFTDKSAVLENCRTAVSKIPSKPSVIEVDMEDAGEAGFLQQLKVSMISTKTVTVVINTSGNITGTFAGVTDVQALTTAATKVVKSCCPGGSSSGCGTKSSACPPKK